MLALKKAKPASLNLYDDDTVKWENEGKCYCLHIQQDEMPMNPRADMDNVTIMACWHRRYRLGDKIEDDEPEDFWRRLVRENVPEEEVFKAARDGKLQGIRLKWKAKGIYDIYETCYWRTAVGSTEPKETLEYEDVAKDSVVYHLMDDLNVGHCMTLMEPYAEWMPLWLYDHSGITMSCGARVGQYADRWDSGCVGWIIALKETVMREMAEYVLDKNGERIRIEHKHEGAPSTWSYLTRPLTDKTWRGRAVEAMKGDVELYDKMLTGDVYRYTLYEREPGDDEDDWNQLDSCWGFFGSDIEESGILYEIGYGFQEAVATGAYETGHAELRQISYYKF